MQKFTRNLLLILCLALPVFAVAEEAQVVQVSGAIYPDFSRILFHSAVAETFEVKLAGNRLQITFPSPLQFDFHSLLKTLNAQVSSATQEQGGRKVVIVLKNAEVRLRKLRGQDFFGVDLLPLKKAETKQAEAEKKPAAAPPLAPSTNVEKKKVEKAKPAIAEKKKPEPVKPPVKKKTVVEAKAKTKTPTASKKAAAKKTVEESAVPVIRTVLEASEEGAPMMPTEAMKVLTVPWDKLVSAAIYVRGDRLWMIFDHYADIPFSALPPKLITSAKQIPDRQSTILKFTLSPALAKNAEGLWAQREQNNWVVYYGKQSVAEKPILITTPEETHENEIKLVVRHAAEPFNLSDPEIGDSLFVVPVRDPGNRVFPGRRFVEFEALPTIQGVVLLRRSDAPTYKVSREGVTVSSKQKLLTSPVVKRSAQEKPTSKLLASIPEEKHELAAETPKSELEKKTMYPFAHQTDPTQFMPIYYKLLKELQAEPEATRSQIRLKMAEHFFLNEYYAEALGLLRDILSDDPEFAATAGIKPMIAGSLFMLGRYDQAADTFSSIIDAKEMPQYAEEQKLWHWASSRMVQQQNLIQLKPKENFDVATALHNYLPSYPFPLRRMLLLAYVDQLLNDSRTGLARKAIKEARALDPLPSEAEMLAYDDARAMLIDGKNDPGIEQMKEVINAEDPRVRMMALAESTRMARKAGKMTLPEAIAALEKGRIDWRGDSVEFGLLKQLGQDYIDNQQYTEGLRVWRELVSQFPGTSESLAVASDMAKVFASLFDTGGAAYKLPPLQALSSFFEFNELIPVGEQGDRISRLLADYLASVDLLENAAAILTHQVRFRSQGDDRAQLALKLIDLHLANDRPDLAQQVLDVMANEKMPSALLTHYHQLRAEILLQQGKYPEALKQLEKDDSATARGLRLAVYWHEQQWERAVSILEPELKARAKKMDTLSPMEEERVLRLAIAYSKLRRFDDLKALKAIYGKRIKNQKIGDSFDFVAESPTQIDYTALESTLELGKIHSFLDKYRLPEKPAPTPPAEVAPAPPAAVEEKAKPAAEH